MGSAVVRELAKQGYGVTVIDNLESGCQSNLPEVDRIEFRAGDILDPDFLSDVVTSHDFLIHLAAKAFIPVSFGAYFEVFMCNVVGTLNVFRACLSRKVERVVHISSAEIYGSAARGPLAEKSRPNPKSPYASSKLAGEVLARCFYRDLGLPVVTMRLFNAYGPRETHPYVIPEAIRQCSKEEVIRLGNLDTERDFTYVEDTASAIVKAVQAGGLEGEVINVGSGQSIKIRSVFQIIQDMLNARGKPVLVDESRLREWDAPKLVASPEKAKKLLGWEASTPLEHGLRQTIDWYNAQGSLWPYEEKTHVQFPR